jgi:uncharacterized membrane protein SpoIIM required for sporulation
MVLESVLSAKLAEENPLFDFAYGVILTVAALVASYFLFPGVSSMLAVVLLSIGIVPVLLKIFYFEEGKRKMGFLETHGRALRFFFVFFLAVSLTVAALHHWLPALGYEGIADNLFSEEVREIKTISTYFQAGNFFVSAAADAIIRNNLIVLLSSFVLSFVFGGGEAFVLTWNAMVFGVFLSNSLGAGAGSFAFSLLYALPELFAYYIGGLSGGLLSAETSSFLTKRKKSMSASIVMNSLMLLLFAAMLIAVMGLIEAVLIT